MTAVTSDAAAARSAVAERRLWYHTMEVAPGVVTPGWFDLRPIADRLPWPDVAGKRCLDVGPYDGFFAFELERRGAREVVAADIGDPASWDWPVAMREQGARAIAEIAGEDPGGGFAIARELLGSSVRRVEVSVYDLSARSVGEFDVVVCGSLMLHLRDPVRALEAIRSVCDEYFLSSETVRLDLGLIHRARPVAELKGGDRGQWWIPSTAGHRKLLDAAGFDVVRSFGPYAIPLGTGHPSYGEPVRPLRDRLLARARMGGTGVPHIALLSKPG
jgi:tRNA (mo5U34)-methyltransferase